MQAPIPAVPEQRTPIQKTRPPGLKAVTLLMCAFSMTGYLWIGPDFGPPLFQIPFFTSIMALSFLILWYFWKGYNWARILVLLGSAMTLGTPFFFADQTTIQNIVSGAEMVLGIFLL